MLRDLRDLRLLHPLLTPHHSPLLTQRSPLRHRSTRTLNPLADAPPHQASPISIPNTTQATSALMIRRYATGAYLWHAIILVALIPAQLRKSGVMIRSTRFGVPSSVATVCGSISIGSSSALRATIIVGSISIGSGQPATASGVADYIAFGHHLHHRREILRAISL